MIPHLRIVAARSAYLLACKGLVRSREEEMSGTFNGRAFCNWAANLDFDHHLGDV